MKKAYRSKDFVQPADERYQSAVYRKIVQCKNCYLYEECVFEFGIPILAHTCPYCGMNWWDDNPLT